MNTRTREKVRQVIEHGSPFQALIDDFISTQDILQYLLETEITPDTMIAYKAVCKFDTSQMIEDKSYSGDTDTPFAPFVLVARDEYVGMYSLLLCKNGTPGRDDKERMKIAKRVEKVNAKLMTVNKFSQILFIICDVPRQVVLKHQEEYRIFVCARSNNYINDYSPKNKIHPKLWVRADCLEPLKDYKYCQCEKLLLARCERLNRKAPLYWESIAKNMYQEFIKGNPQGNRVRTGIQNLQGLKDTRKLGFPAPCRPDSFGEIKHKIRTFISEPFHEIIILLKERYRKPHLFKLRL